MALLLILLLALPALAQPADCPSVPVGPPMDVEIYVDLSGRVKVPVPGPVIAGLGLTGLPANGTRCLAPPPEAGDILRGPPAPGGLLRGDGPADILGDRRVPEVVVGPARAVSSRPDAVRP